MRVSIKPSDLQYRYPRNHEHRSRPRFSGVPDPAPFDRNDLFEVIPMFEVVMTTLGSRDAEVLHRLEEILDKELPVCVTTREEVYACLVGAMREVLR